MPTSTRPLQTLRPALRAQRPPPLVDSLLARLVVGVIEQDHLVENAAKVGNYLLEELKKFPQIKEVRGRGLMIGLEFEEPIKELRSRLIYDEHVFTGASGTNVLRLLPPLCLSMEEADEFLARFKRVL